MIVASIQTSNGITASYDDDEGWKCDDKLTLQFLQTACEPDTSFGTPAMQAVELAKKFLGCSVTLEPDPAEVTFGMK
jgi:hypothetical protein